MESNSNSFSEWRPTDECRKYDENFYMITSMSLYKSSSCVEFWTRTESNLESLFNSLYELGFINYFPNMRCYWWYKKMRNYEYVSIVPLLLYHLILILISYLENIREVNHSLDSIEEDKQRPWSYINYNENKFDTL